MCVFVGYPLHERSYKFLHPIPHKYFLSMNITFPEDCPFFLVSLLHEVKVWLVLFIHKIGENDKYDIVVSEDMGEKGIVDEIEVMADK